MIKKTEKLEDGWNDPSSAQEVGRRIDAVFDLFPSRKEAADVLGMSTDQLGRYVKGTSPPLSVLIKLKQSKNISIDWLASGNGPMILADAKIYDSISMPSHALEEFVLLPRYSVRASAGGGAVVNSEQIVDHLAFKSTWVRNTLRRAPANLILIEAQGDSMEPTISDGDLLLVDTSENKIRDYAVYVFSLNGDLLVKRVQRKMSGDLVITSDNEKYKPDYVDASVATELNVVGQVVWHGGVI